MGVGAGRIVMTGQACQQTTQGSGCSLRAHQREDKATDHCDDTSRQYCSRVLSLASQLAAAHVYFHSVTMSSDNKTSQTIELAAACYPALACSSSNCTRMQLLSTSPFPIASECISHYTTTVRDACQLSIWNSKHHNKLPFLTFPYTNKQSAAALGHAQQCRRSHEMVLCMRALCLSRGLSLILTA